MQHSLRDGWRSTQGKGIFFSYPLSIPSQPYGAYLDLLQWNHQGWGLGCGLHCCGWSHPLPGMICLTFHPPFLKTPPSCLCSAIPPLSPKPLAGRNSPHWACGGAAPGTGFHACPANSRVCENMVYSLCCFKAPFGLLCLNICTFIWS